MLARAEVKLWGSGPRPSTGTYGKLSAMPYKDRADRNARARQVWQERRAAWFAANGPCVDCQSWESLELDHVDPNTKVSHRVWSWANARRLAELSKCVARCHRCHRKKTVGNNEHAYGEALNLGVLSSVTVREARALYATGKYTWPELGAKYKVKHNTLRRACKDCWKHVS